MCPVLSRKHYFLTVLNMPVHEAELRDLPQPSYRLLNKQRQPVGLLQEQLLLNNLSLEGQLPDKLQDSQLEGQQPKELQDSQLEGQMYGVLLELAHIVSRGEVIELELAERINVLFQRYRAINLRLELVQPAIKPKTEETQREAGIVLSAVFADAEEQRKRMYMEAIISLLEAIEAGDLELQRCELCGHWFIPYSRAGVTKFCGTKCRNRYHYLQRRSEREGEKSNNDYIKV